MGVVGIPMLVSGAYTVIGRVGSSVVGMQRKYQLTILRDRYSRTGRYD